MNMTPCPYCGTTHPSAKCYLVKAIEYFPDGQVKRVEFMTPRDLNVPSALTNTPISVPSIWQPFGISTNTPISVPSIWQPFGISYGVAPQAQCVSNSNG